MTIKPPFWSEVHAAVTQIGGNLQDTDAFFEQDDLPTNRSPYNLIHLAMRQMGQSNEDATRIAKEHDASYRPAKADDTQSWETDKDISAKDLRPRHGEN